LNVRRIGARRCLVDKGAKIDQEVCITHC
jgi:hypothetical protein